MKFARDLVPQIDELPTRQRRSFPEIEDADFWSFYEACKDHSLVQVTGFYNVYQSFKYIAANRIPGAAVECGCFLGGISMFIGLMRKNLKLSGMDIIIFDTFEGPPVGSTDTMLGAEINTPAPLPSYRDLVPANMTDLLGSLDGVRFVEGLVEDTLPVTNTGEIAFLRLDTDFYSSTKIELETLYPRLARGGVLIIDDYGMFQGARRATNEYFEGHPNPPLLNRIDTGIWAGVKP